MNGTCSRDESFRIGVYNIVQTRKLYLCWIVFQLEQRDTIILVSFIVFVNKILKPVAARFFPYLYFIVVCHGGVSMLYIHAYHNVWCSSYVNVSIFFFFSDIDIQNCN